MQGASSSDPQEGGGIVGAVDSAGAAGAPSPKRPKSGVAVGDIPIVKQSDKSTSTLRSTPGDGAAVREPAKLEVPNLKATAMADVAHPPPYGILTVVVPRKSLATGKHFPKPVLTANGRTYTSVTRSCPRARRRAAIWRAAS